MHFSHEYDFHRPTPFLPPHATCPPSAQHQSDAPPSLSMSNASNKVVDDFSPKYCGQKNKKPEKYKTEMCHNWELFNTCKNSCWYAHGVEELRQAQHHPKYKTEPCKWFYRKGTCNYGQRCNYIHPNDLTIGVDTIKHTSATGLSFEPTARRPCLMERIGNRTSSHGAKGENVNSQSINSQSIASPYASPSKHASVPSLSLWSEFASSADVSPLRATKLQDWDWPGQPDVACLSSPSSQTGSLSASPTSAKSWSTQSSCCASKDAHIYEDKENRHDLEFSMYARTTAGNGISTPLAQPDFAALDRYAAAFKPQRYVRSEVRFTSRTLPDEAAAMRSMMQEHELKLKLISRRHA